MKAQLKADFSADHASGCSPLTVSFSNKTTGASATATYLWTLGNNNTSSDMNAGAVYYDAKTYTVTLTVKDGAQTDTKTETITVYKQPNVDFTLNPPKGCAPIEITFTSKSTAGDGTITDYFWDFGDGNTQKGAGDESVKHTYTFAQNPPVKLTVTNSHGCYAISEKTDVLQITQGVKVNFNADKTILCALPDQVSFTNTSTGPGTLSYNWDFADNKTATDKTPSPVSYNTKGIYPVKLKVTSSEGCSDSLVKNNYINAANFSSKFDLPTPACTQRFLTFVNKSQPTPNQSVWVFSDDNANAFGNTVSHFYQRTGQFNVKLVNTFGGCYDTTTLPININATTSLNGYLNDKTGACKSPLTVNFKDTSSSAVKWLWNFGTGVSGDTSNQQNPSFTFTQNRNYNVTLTVTNAGGCPSSFTKAINIARPNISFGYTKSNSIYGLSGCPGLSIKFKSFPVNEVAEYKWDFGDGGSSTEAEPEHVFNAVGKFTVKLVYKTTGGCEDSVFYVNYVTTYSKPKAAFESESGLAVCGNAAVKFKNLTDTSNRWLWNFGDGATSTLQNPIHSYTSGGTFTVTLISTNNTCSDTTKADREQILKLSGPFPDITSFSRNCAQKGTIIFKQASKGVNEWVWDFGDGSPTETYTVDKPQVSHNYTKSGVYRVTLFTTAGCTTYDTAYVSILLKQNPVLTADKEIICGSDTISVKLTGMDTIRYYYEPTKQIYTYPYSGRWLYSDGTLHSQTTTWYPPEYKQTLTKFRPGEDSIRLITYDAINGCYDTSNYIHLKVSGPVAGFKTANTIRCVGATIDFTDISTSSGNAVLNKWIYDFGDGFKDTLTSTGNVSHTYRGANYFYPKLKVYDANGCFAETVSNASYLTIYGPAAGFYAKDTVVSPNAQIQFFNTTETWPGYPVTYNWDFGDKTTPSTVNAPSHAYTQSGTYTVRLIAKSTFGCIDTVYRKNYIEVKSVKSIFKLNASYVNGNSCPPLLGKFENTSLNADSIFWNFGDKSYADNSRTPSHTYYQPGVYRITLYAFGKGGVVDSSSQEITVNGPYGVITPNLYRGCTPTELSLSAAAKNAVNFTWDFDDGFVSLGKDSIGSHTYNNPGVFFPKVIMKDAAGCTATFLVKDSIIIDQVKAKIFPSDKILCDTGLVRFKSNIISFAKDSLKFALEHHWNFGTDEPTDTSNLQDPAFYYNKASFYPVKYQVKSPFGCTSNATDSILVLKKPTGTISALNEICETGIVNFSGLVESSDTTTLKWKWTFGNGNQSTEKTPQPQAYNQPGRYLINLEVYNDPSCAATLSQPLTVHANPHIGLTPRDSSICLGDTISLIAHDGINYQWTSDGISMSSNLSAIKISPVQNTLYGVHVINQFSCSSDDSIKISVSQPFEISLNGNDFEVCENSPVRLQASGAVRYKWIPAIGLSNADISNPIASPTQSTNYNVVGYGSDQCFTDTSQVKITIVPLPKVNAGKDTLAVVGSTIPLAAITSNDVTQIKWSPASYLNCSNCKAPISEPRQSITYVASVRNDFGCVAADSVKITLQCSNTNVFIPNSFTPNRDGVNDLFYPRGKGIKNVKYFRVFDRWGELIFEKTNFNIDDSRMGWDGKFKDQKLATGVFVYTTEMECDTNESLMLKGTIMIIR